ncbi:conserved hypothetical protein [Lodderomyces elongisporus NRRL YB-4239]|uniref:mRNA-decapping enzyme subunit 1 n=1 Tax=Lodderomyces elongisporus (strain ATCC 11503 / CBS 2605 / JCM 1781 / NBRC 1676 / NRRL YB-4239) TaxID=379508 RepID=A5DWK6_LODEL|nr:conserved hypothetical protein [Lodderomyces elongisporus NRRL YB-4239]
MTSAVQYQNSGFAEESLSREEALKLYTNALNFNVISRYDPAIKQLLSHTSHCVLYKFDHDSDEWIKTDFQGTMALYARDSKLHINELQRTIQQMQPTVELVQHVQDLFQFGLILLNRTSPECFSVGIVPSKLAKALEGKVFGDHTMHEMEVELNDNLIIVRNLYGDIFGLWVFDEEDRSELFKLLQYCLDFQ